MFTQYRQSLIKFICIVCRHCDVQFICIVCRHCDVWKTTFLSTKTYFEYKTVQIISEQTNSLKMKIVKEAEFCLKPLIRFTMNIQILQNSLTNLRQIFVERKMFCLTRCFLFCFAILYCWLAIYGLLCFTTTDPKLMLLIIDSQHREKCK